MDGYRASHKYALLRNERKVASQQMSIIPESVSMQCRPRSVKERGIWDGPHCCRRELLGASTHSFIMNLLVSGCCRLSRRRSPERDLHYCTSAAAMFAIFSILLDLLKINFQVLLVNLFLAAARPRSDLCYTGVYIFASTDMTLSLGKVSK